MKKLSLTFLCLLIASGLVAQQSLRLFYENKNRGYILYAENTELYPISISLELDLENMDFSERQKKIFVIPARYSKYKIGEMSASDNRRGYKFNYKFRSVMGDVTITSYDTSIRYDLPYKKGSGYTVLQGYNGKFSHTNENALDFDMPEGTEITAAREGVVVKIVQSNTQSCPTPDCMQYNNYVTIMHADGSFANYVHIKQNGALVKPGDKVKAGDVIAQSGKVGWVTAAHLHFVCFLGGMEKWNTLPTPFKIDKGDQAILLKAGNNYAKDY
jgi:murein DD-endopeptidase MepM/ murein hydrolase activator NlpD